MTIKDTEGGHDRFESSTEKTNRLTWDWRSLRQQRLSRSAAQTLDDANVVDPFLCLLEAHS